MDKQELNRNTLYDISLAIGDTLDQRKMLSRSLSTYLKKLNCSMGAIFHAKRQRGEVDYEIAYSIPRSFERRADTYQQLIMHHASEAMNQGLDIIEGEIEGNHWYMMSLSDIGFLFLVKPDSPIDQVLLDALRPLNMKLGEAFRACQQNDAYMQSSQQYKEMANMLPGILFELDRDKRITFINRRTYELFKTIDSDQFKPETIYELLGKDQIPKLDSLFEKVEQGTSLISDDLWMKTLRGELLPVSLNLSPITQNQEIVGFRGIATDISERMKFEEKQRVLLRQLSENVREMNCLYSIARLSSDSNKSLQDIFSEAVKLIPEAFEKSDEISAVISFREKTFQSDPFRETASWIQSEIYINDDTGGQVRIYGPDDYTFQQHETDLLEALSHQFENIASKMIIDKERQRLYTSIMDDLEMAQSVQNFLLPPWFINNEDILLSSDYSPSSKIGGDLFDLIRINDHEYIIYIGDISGHGVQAALTMTAVKSIINITLQEGEIYRQPHTIVSKLNAFLSTELFHENYMTFCYIYIDLKDRMIHSLSAGHPMGVVIDRHSKKAEFLEDRGSIPLGWLDAHEYLESDVLHTPLEENKLYLFYTDGLFECSDAQGNQLGLDGLLTFLNEEVRSYSVITLPHIIKKRLKEMQYDLSLDDFTTLVFCENYYMQKESNTRLFQVRADINSTMAIAENGEQFVLSKIDDPVKGLQVKLVIEEFLNNIIEHGLRGLSETFILLEIKIQGSTIFLTFRDKGILWELPRKEDPDTFFSRKNSLSDDRGRGIQMIYGVITHAVRKRINEMNVTIFTIPWQDGVDASENDRANISGDET